MSDKNDEYKQKSNEIMRLASLPPDEFSTHLNLVHNTLDAVAPNVAPHIYATAANAVNFLASKLPKSQNPMVQDDSHGPSTIQQRAWLNLHKLVNDPLTIFDHVNNSTINSHHIQALQSVYPDLHQEMINQTLEEIGKRKISGEKIPYAKRVALSKFIGQPLDSTMSLGSMQAIIKSAGPQQAASAPAQGKPKKAPTGAQIKALSETSDIYKTDIQARQSNKQKS